MLMMGRHLSFCLPPAQCTRPGVPLRSRSSGPHAGSLLATGCLSTRGRRNLPSPTRGCGGSRCRSWGTRTWEEYQSCGLGDRTGANHSRKRHRVFLAVRARFMSLLNMLAASSVCSARLESCCETVAAVQGHGGRLLLGRLVYVRRSELVGVFFVRTTF